MISTVNIQHLESLNDVVERITGVGPAGDRARRGRPRGRPDRAGRHEPGGAAPAAGSRQRLPGRAGRCGSRQLLPRRATSPPCGNSRCCGWPIVSRSASRTTYPTTASPTHGRRASGWSSPSPAWRGEHLDPPRGPDGRTGRGRAHRGPRRHGRRLDHPAGRRRWTPSVELRRSSSGGRITKWSATTSPRRSPAFASVERATQLVLGRQPRHSPRCRDPPGLRRRPRSCRRLDSIDVHVIADTERRSHGVHRRPFPSSAAPTALPWRREAGGVGDRGHGCCRS